MNRLLCTIVLTLPFLGFAPLAQSQVLLRVQFGNNVSSVTNGSTISVVSPAPGVTRDLKVIVTYIGSTELTFTGPPKHLGSPDFSVAFDGYDPSFPLAPNQSATIAVTFKPSSVEQALASFDLSFSEAAPPAAPGALPSSPRTGLISLGLAGGVPVIGLQYLFQTDGNAVGLAPGGTISFPATVVNSQASSTIALLNTGSGSGRIESISVSGASYSLASVPILPANIATGSSLQFGILYRPRQAGADEGQLTVTLDGGIVQTYNLKGEAVTSFLGYEIVPDQGAPVPVNPGQTLTLPPAALGSRSQIQLRFRNTSKVDLLLNGISVSGPPFGLTNTPFFPLTIAPGVSETFTVFYQPVELGRQSGRLRIGNDTFELSGEALGSLLGYSFQPTPDTAPVTLLPQGLINLPVVRVGLSSKVDVIVDNLGTSPATINAIGVASDSRGVFSLTGLPPFPTQIPRGGQLRFSVQFLPNTVGQAAATLRIEGVPFVLSGFGEEPVPLPDYAINGPAQVAPLQQPRISLSLSAPYTLPLSGTITLSRSSEYGNDPSVLFSNGARTVEFTIPANTTAALFPGGVTEVSYQTGSVAGTITFTPSFRTEGGLSLTPVSPKTLRTTLPASAPVLLGVQVAERSAASLTLRISGYTTTRSLSKVDLKFEAVPGFNVSNLNFTFDLAGASAVWFNSPASANFGGQFVIDVQFLLSTSDRTPEAVAPVSSLQSVAVTVANSIGNSESKTLSLR